MEIRACWGDYRVVPAQVRITQEQAIQKATTAVQEYVAHNPQDKRILTTGILANGTLTKQPNASLQYVVPCQYRIVNGLSREQFDKYVQRTFPKYLRLAWVVHVGLAEVWIDAAEGAQLGATISVFA